MAGQVLKIIGYPTEHNGSDTKIKDLILKIADLVLNIILLEIADEALKIRGCVIESCESCIENTGCPKGTMSY